MKYSQNSTIYWIKVITENLDECKRKTISFKKILNKIISNLMKNLIFMNILGISNFMRIEKLASMIILMIIMIIMKIMLMKKIKIVIIVMEIMIIIKNLNLMNILNIRG